MMPWDGVERRKKNLDRINQIEKDLARLVYILEEDAKNRYEFRERIESLIERHQEALYGNGKPGILTRMKEVETAQENHRLNIRVIWGAFIAIVFKISYDFVVFLTRRAT